MPAGSSAALATGASTVRAGIVHRTSTSARMVASAKRSIAGCCTATVPELGRTSGAGFTRLGSLPKRPVDSGQEQRFGLLETIRDYALERLDAHSECALMRARHAEYYLGSAEVVVDQISSGHQPTWLRSLELEHDNVRAALAWCHEAGAPELGLRAAGLLA